MKTVALILLCVLCALVPAAAHADYAFSGSGSSGTLASSSEIWNFNFDMNFYVHDNWGSPGFNDGRTNYGEASTAYGFEITFAGGGAIDPATFYAGGDTYCLGATTFCRYSGPGGEQGWAAFQLSADSIAFFAQDPLYGLAQGEPYFVNVVFDGATPTSFTGAWLTSFTPTPTTVTPEPTSLLLLGTGLIGATGQLGLRRVRRKQTI